ncbi:uncharacterized protein LOC100574689 [Acyrthosiphon pisum]|uniref:Uncharacterized protein n=1 Tax=Acyrthosiphon pisum TaxID=7029 RepID=A0A8R1W7C1_ACYPI|nr:uncharacterized protein LOC100574689 [Acyrthosiphon pisum]|eukprot:XP_003248890.1 PREDICTED: uncharacterized protein LOC100574689 [Acyrthosiphon pisum]
MEYFQLVNYSLNLETYNQNVNSVHNHDSFELTQNSGITKLKTIRKLYNDVCNTFGQTDIGVWSDCIRFEYMYGSHKLVKEIYKASLLCLEPDLRNGMTKEFEKLKEEFMEDDPKDGGVIVIDDDE